MTNVNEDIVALRNKQIARLVEAMNEINDEVNIALFCVREGDSAETVFNKMIEHLRKIEELATYTDEDITASRSVPCVVGSVIPES